MPRPRRDPPRDKPLSLREAAFCDEYLVDGIAGRAYERAGYKASGHAADVEGGKKLREPRIALRIKELQAARSKRTRCDADWVVRVLRKNIKRAMQEEEVVDREGNGTGVFKYEGAVVNGAAALLGKHLGMFDDHVPREKALALVERFIAVAARHVDEPTLIAMRAEWSAIA